MSKRVLWLLGAALLLLQPLAAAGQKVKPADRGPWEVSAFLGSIQDSPEFDPDGSAFFVDPDRNVLFGVGVNYHFPGGFFLGADGRYAPWDMRPAAGGVTDLNSYFISGLLGYTLPLQERVDVYGVGGPTAALWRPRNNDSELDLGLTYGGGFRVYLSEKFALNAHYRMTQVPSALEDVSRSVTGLTADDTFWGHSFSGGISIFFGSDNHADGDGVGDGTDTCPDTPAGVDVDGLGCPVDTDGDGVADYQDRCPNTPAGARVDGQGCPVDSDGDGVFDGLDQCSGTPRGAEVDGSGCPVDSDGDGVFNGLDQCPNTPGGAEVDSSGCPVPEPVPEPEVFTFEGSVNFEFDSARLTPQGQTGLREIGDVLITHEDLSIVVEGHADSVGADDYNERLSLERAEAVRDFLVENYTQLTSGQFSVLGFGETRPVADNGTGQGRAQNRRVVVIVGG